MQVNLKIKPEKVMKRKEGVLVVGQQRKLTLPHNFKNSDPQTYALIFRHATWKGLDHPCQTVNVTGVAGLTEAAVEADNPFITVWVETAVRVS